MDDVTEGKTAAAFPAAQLRVGAPHSLAVDSEGSIYVGEVTHTFLISRGHAPEGCHMFQKFARVR